MKQVSYSFEQKETSRLEETGFVWNNFSHNISYLDVKNSRVSRAKVKIIKGLTLSDFKTRKNGLAQLHPYLQSPRLQKNLTRASFLKKALRMRPKSQSGSTLKRKFSTLMKTSVTDMKSSKQEQRHKLIEESWALMKK